MQKLFNVFSVVILINIISVSSVSAQLKEQGPETLKPVVYYMVLLDIGEKWKNSDVSILRAPALMKTMQEHRQYMYEMNQKGALVLGGPFLTDLETFMQSGFINGGMLLYRTETLKEAEEKVRNDPIIQSGAMVVKDIKPFLIFVGGVKQIKQN